MSPTLCVKITWIRLIITRGVLCLYWLRLFQNNRVPQYKLSFNSSKVKHVCVSQRCNTMLICSARARKTSRLCAQILCRCSEVQKKYHLYLKSMIWCDVMKLLRCLKAASVCSCRGALVCGVRSVCVCVQERHLGHAVCSDYWSETQTWRPKEERVTMFKNLKSCFAICFVAL